MEYRKIVIAVAVCVIATLYPRCVSAQIFSVRMNALSAVAATIDAGAEISVADKWTVGVSGCFNPVKNARISTSFYAIRIESKYWLYESFVGHFIGAHVTYANYDVGRRNMRYDGIAGGLGFSYGYSWMLSKRWNVTVHGGLGIFRTKDVRRDTAVGDWDDEYVYHYRRWILLPTNIGVSFSYLF